jgi:GNAT superfamily N-acetyltransferase
MPSVAEDALSALLDSIRLRGQHVYRGELPAGEACVQPASRCQSAPVAACPPDGDNPTVTSVSVEQVEPYATVWLRQRVLRPHQTYDEVLAVTDVPDLFAIGALVERALVSCVVAHPEPLPEEPGRPDAWRLRGMATDPTRQGQGYGAAVLARMLDELRLRGAALVWCNARTPAEGLYRRAGFVTIGDPWDDPAIGSHVRMWRGLAR